MPAWTTPGALSENGGLEIAVALGIGLLIGAERERRKGTGPARQPAGVRTFALAGLLGGLAGTLGGAAPVVVAGLAIGALTLSAYLRAPTSDPGLTTEVALVVTFFLGSLRPATQLWPPRSAWS
jgi:hypothetical protein